MMDQRRKFSLPADNPEYFNVAAGWRQSEVNTSEVVTTSAGAGVGQTMMNLDNISEFIEPTSEVVQSLKNIEKLAEKQNSSKSRKSRLGSLKRFFSSGGRRESSAGVENEYLPAPAPHHHYGSLPTTPTKVTNNNVFRLSTDSTKSVLIKPKVQTISKSCSVTANLDVNKNETTYYNVTSVEKFTAPKTPIRPSLQISTKPENRVFRLRTLSLSSPNQRTVWPGMEAPTLPPLHASCRGFSVKEIPNVVILFFGGCSESRKWRDYLGKEMEAKKRTVTGQRLEEFGEISNVSESDLCHRKCEELVYHCDLVIVVISKKFLSWLEKSKVVIGKILQPSRVVGVLLDIIPLEIKADVQHCLQTFPCWRTVDIQESGERSDFLIGQSAEEILSKQDRLSVCPSEPKYKVFPRKLSPSQPKLMIILENKVDVIDQENISIKVTQEDFHFTIDEAKWIRDDIVQIEIPPVMFQSTMIASIILTINQTNFGSRQLKLENAATVLENAWQHCIDPITMLSDAFGLRFVNSTDIDEFLSANIEKKLSVTDLLTTKYRGCCNVTDPSECLNKDHTNLLHFAASHGFTRLCRTLLSAGHQRYLNLPNILGLSPAECAEKHGYHSLAQELRGLTPAAPALASSSPNVLEGEDGYLIPEISNIHSFSDYQIPQIGNRPIQSSLYDKKCNVSAKSRLDSVSSDEFYQVPPAPVPLASTTSINNNYIPSSPPQDTSSSLTSSSSTPPKYRISRQGLGYIPMLAPIRKAVSDIGPKSDSSIFVPKSGSFSHFTSTAATSPVRRDDFIAKFCQEQLKSPKTRQNRMPEHEDKDLRPESSPPILNSQNIFIPIVDNLEPDPGDSSPLDHYVHTDKHLDGLVYLPMDHPDYKVKE